MACWGQSLLKSKSNWLEEVSLLKSKNVRFLHTSDKGRAWETSQSPGTFRHGTKKELAEKLGVTLTPRPVLSKEEKAHRKAAYQERNRERINDRENAANASNSERKKA